MAAAHLPSGASQSARTYANDQTVALSGTTNKTTALTVGKTYIFQCASAWHVNFGAQSSVTATTSHFLVAAGQTFEYYVPSASYDGVAGILDSSTATLYVLKVVDDAA